MKINCALYGVYIALALICSYLESFISLPFVTPGIKLGFTNIVILIVMYIYGVKASIIVSITRVLLVGILFGNGFTLFYSIAGAILAAVSMGIALRSGYFSEIGISIVGALAHNLGQLFVAVIVLNTFSVAYYFIVLMVSALLTGGVIGVLVNKMLPRIRKIQGRGTL